MSSLLCFICHNSINSHTKKYILEKYRELIGFNLCPDSHLCYICCHMVNKLWLFKSVCLKSSLDYPSLVSEKGTHNFQLTNTETNILCADNNCVHQNTYHQFYYNNDKHHEEYYVKKIQTDNNYQHNTFNDDNNQNYIEINQTQNNCVMETNEKLTREGTNESESLHNHIETINDSSLEDANHDNCNEDHLCEMDNDIQGPDTEVITSDDDDNIQKNTELNDNESVNELKTEELASKKKTKKKIKKKGYTKTVLSLEEQKAELEAQRRKKKYLEAEFKCYSCALGFLFKDTYQVHMMRHEESNGEHVCAACGLRFASARVLRAHTALHAEKHVCNVCGATLRNNRTRKHATLCHRNSDPSATCHLCGNVFQDSSSLQQHLKRFHRSKKNNRMYSCNVCGNTYNNQAAVRTHMIKHIQRKFSCVQCNATFSSPYTLNQHKKKHTQSETEEQHFCDTCGISYNSRKSLLAHKRNSLNHQNRSYECTICNRVCPNQRALSSHVSTVHAASKPFACPHCPVRYNSRKSLTRHVTRHTRPSEPAVATCHLCGKHFKGNSKLNRHIREVCEKNKLEEELSAYYEQNAM